MGFYRINLFKVVFYFIIMEANGTKLDLNYSIVSGPYGNVWIKTKIDGKPEKLPFESMYLKENPKEVLSFLAKEYLVTKYLDIDPTSKHSPRFGDISEGQTFDYKGHLILSNGFSIQHSKLEGVTINNEFHKNVNISFLPKRTIEKKEENIKNLIKTYIVRTNTFPEHFYNNLRTGCHEVTTKTTTTNYFQERKKKKDELKEKQLSQILEYAQIILNKPEFSINNLEEMASETSTLFQIKKYD